MNAPRACPTCGSPATLDGLCPACLLQQGLATQTLAAGAPGTTRMPCPGEDFGPYRILRRLGGGGMGEVFEVEHRENGRRLALKVIAQDLATAQDRQRFLREGRLAASVSHPNVVYVYGSEEIEGTPAIAMELAPGGTLKDLVKKDRPLAPAAAVDAMLQVISGLDAAHAAGVLHRDIKPANCFRDADGGVKVGDFGLSIPADGRRDAQVTAPGSLLGSPAFASPEQLRGEALDVRSDIYSVGATLYYLLTARAPHEGDSVVNVIAAALGREPPAPHTLAPAVPEELSRLVMRCLAKQAGDRFASYAQLRDALLSFGSTAAVPAPLGLRFLAEMADGVLVLAPAGLAFAALSGLPTSQQFLIARSIPSFALWLATWLGAAIYYALLEARWGASLGKALCGLRVVRTDRSRAGLARLLPRALIFTGVPTLLNLLDLILFTGEEYAHAVYKGIFTWGDLASFLGPFVVVLSMRPRNGWAGLHDLATDTRVVQTPRAQGRPAPGIAPAPRLPTSEKRNFGPYAAVAALGSAGEGVRLTLARDEVLRREVWVVEHPVGTATVSPERRDLARPARLRWLNGRRTETEAWDAVEAPDGRSLRALAGCEMAGRPAEAGTPTVGAPPSGGKRGDKRGEKISAKTGTTNGSWPAAGFAEWASVRFWLADLAQELAAGLRDGSLPPLSLDHVWITATGRARLLDFPAPGGASPASPIHPATSEGAQQFLAAVAGVCLGNRNPSPLAAAQFLGTLRAKPFPALEIVGGNVASFCEKPAAVSRLRRLASLSLAPGLALAMGIAWAGITLVETGVYDRKWTSQNPERPSPRLVMSAWWKNSGNSSHAGEIGKFFRQRYAVELKDPNFVRQLDYIDSWNGELPEVADLSFDNSILTEGYPAGAAQAPDARLAEGLFSPLKPDQEKRVLETLAGIRRLELGTIGRHALILSALGMGVVAALGLVCTLLGNTPLLRLFGIAVVDARGRLASRWRLLGRWAVAWPGTLGFSWMSARMFGHLLIGHRPDTAWMLQTGFPITLMLVVLGSVLVMVLNPSRGFQDEQAGTWLVPR